eukprot:629977-Pelagomonas_calceolata.AAC.3
MTVQFGIQLLTFVTSGFNLGHRENDVIILHGLAVQNRMTWVFFLLFLSGFHVPNTQSLQMVLACIHVIPWVQGCFQPKTVLFATFVASDSRQQEVLEDLCDQWVMDSG